MRRTALVLAVIALTSSSAQAQTTLLNDNFNAENGGASALNYSAFANWDVTGLVDVVRSPDYGITCAGSCVDLDGSGLTAGKITTKLAYSFAAGDVMRFSVDVSGNQRNSAVDFFTFGMQFGGGPTIVSCNTVGLGCVTGFPLNSYSSGQTIAGTTGFSTRFIEFTAGTSGTVRFSLETSSADNVGPLVDNVLLTRTSTTSTVPEPSTWALMLSGLAAMGIVARRRRTGTAL